MSAETTDTERIARYYDSDESVEGMVGVRGWLGLARLRQELLRTLPGPPADIVDVGGGTGAHARWLAPRGFSVSLVDISAGQLEAARSALNGELLTDVQIADARHLSWSDGSFDAALLFGPLYHLLQGSERNAALKEAYRVCRSGGLVLAEGLGRLTPILNVLRRQEEGERSKLEEAWLIYTSGAYGNREGRTDWFTTSYYHTPEELTAEVSEAGFEVVDTFAVEGPLWLLPDLESRRVDRASADLLLNVAEQLSRDAGAIANSPHFIVVGRKPLADGHSDG